MCRNPWRCSDREMGQTFSPGLLFQVETKDEGPQTNLNAPRKRKSEQTDAKKEINGSEAKLGRLSARYCTTDN